MKYILDFDGVIFNVQALKKKMAELGIAEVSRSKKTFDEIEQKDPSFDIRTLVFRDALLFLEKHRTDCVIVSSYVSASQHGDEVTDTQREYQETKIVLSGVADIIGAAQVHVVGKSKTEMLQELQVAFAAQADECVFIDDWKERIEEAEDLGISSFWMNRQSGGHYTEAPGESRSFTEIGNFEDLKLKMPI